MENLNEMKLVKLGAQATKETDGGYINSKYVVSDEGGATLHEIWAFIDGFFTGDENDHG